MDPIPEWVWKLWGAWDVRIFVLLSLTLQIILCIFGHRRKYINSLWISILVWLAYLMADWVATVALGKLSNERTSNSNNTTALRAIWAPLLLLHLGGPDTITAYSLEDNQLWMRHLMGLAVQLVVAVYVILISWRNFGFLYFSFPALLAGIIKYGERTWVLKSVCSDKSADIVPLGIVRRSDNAIVSDRGFLDALLSAHLMLKNFKSNMETFEISYRIRDESDDDGPNFQWNDTCWVDALEVEMGLMYDILFTKAAKTYTKRGCLLRSISFACTMSISVGLLWLISRKERLSLEQDYDSMLVDIIITGLLLVGALALEIYALTMLLTSDWTMIWLIKQKREKLVIQLGKKISWLFPMDRKRRWSKKMGQFDALGFGLKQKDMNTSMLSRVLGSFGMQIKFNKYMHKTSSDVPPCLYSMISHYLRFLSNPNSTLHDQEMFQFAEDDFLRDYRTFEEQLFLLHFATESLFMNDVSAWNANTSQNIGNTSGGGGVDDNQTIRETCRTLSRYMMYLYVMCPSLLPLFIFNSDLLFKNINEGTEEGSTWHDLTRYLKEKQEVERWRILKNMWLKMICRVAFKAPKNNHLKQLTQGGELLTLVWFFIAQAGKLRGLDAGVIDSKLNNPRP